MTHIQRMQVEAAELAEKVNKLTNFIEGSDVYVRLDAIRQQLLVIQLHSMNAYLAALNTRISTETQHTSTDEKTTGGKT